MGTIDKIYLDSNFIIAALVSDHPQHPKSKEIIERHLKLKLLVSLLTLDEVIHTLNLAYNLSRLDLSFKVESFLNSKEVKLCDAITTFNNPIKQYLHLYVDYNLSPRDTLHYLMMKANKISHIATFDNDFIKNQKKLKIKVLN